MEAFKKNIAYIWDYYKVPLLGIPLLLLLILYVFTSLTGSDKEQFYLYFINHSISEDERAQLESNLTLELCKSGGVDGVLVDASLTITPDTPDYDSQMSFTASVAGHTVDVMIADEAFLDYYADMNSLADLSGLLPEELCDALDAFLIRTEDADGTSHAYGLDVSGCPALSALGLDASVLTVAKVSEHVDADISFIRYLFGK